MKRKVGLPGWLRSCRFVIGMVAMLACTDATLPAATLSCCKNAPGISPPPRV